MFIRVVLGLIALFPVSASAQSRADEARFATVPCPTAAWTYDERQVSALPGAKIFTGRYSGGLYVIEIPDNWNGELALWAHGNVNPDNAGRTSASRADSGASSALDPQRLCLGSIELSL